jgi:hypothetical protein
LLGSNTVLPVLDQEGQEPMTTITPNTDTTIITKTEDTPQRWRDVLPVHPAAELFPLMSESELRELGEDIKKNGLEQSVVLWSPGARDDYYVHPNSYERKPKKQPIFLLDGRNRLVAMELVGHYPFLDKLLNNIRQQDCLYEEHAWNGHRQPDVDPYAYVISANIQRRHLTAEQKRELIAKLLKAKPEQSNRQIAKQTKASHVTVGAERKKLESTGQIDQLKKTKGADGKERPTRRQLERKFGAPKAPSAKPKAEQKTFDCPQEAHESNIAEHVRSFSDAIRSLPKDKRIKAIDEVIASVGLNIKDWITVIPMGRMQ